MIISYDYQLVIITFITCSSSGGLMALSSETLFGIIFSVICLTIILFFLIAYWTKRSYTQFLFGFNDNWLIVLALSGLLFTIWGSLAPSYPLIPGDIWLLAPGLLLILSSAILYFSSYFLKHKVLLSLRSLPDSGASFTSIADQLHLSLNHLLLLVSCLRLEGKIALTIDEQKGLLIPTDPSKESVCSLCGQDKLSGSFCSFCGTEISQKDE
jgi:hypothetical protein